MFGVISKNISILFTVLLLLVVIFIPTLQAENITVKKPLSPIMKKTIFFHNKGLFKKLISSFFKTDIDDFQEIKPKWVNYWGGDRHEGDCQIAVGRDNNCIYVSGNSMSFSDSMRPFLVKYDLNGKKLWDKTIFEQEGAVFSITAENDYVYAAGLIFSSSDNIDVFITKYDQNGNKIWFKKWDDSSCDIGFSILCVKNTIYVAGRTIHKQGSNDVLLLCFKDKGSTCKLSWSKIWGGDKDDVAIGMAFYNHDLYICGTTMGLDGRDTHDGLLLKFDTSDVDSKPAIFDIWSTQDYDQFHDVAVKDDSLFVVGWTQGYSHEYDIVLLKYNLETKQLEWQRIWGELENNIGYGLSISDDNVFVVGEIHEFNGITEKGACIVLKFDFEGTLIWSKIWGKKIFAHGEDIQFYLDNLYVGGRCIPGFKSYTDVFVFNCDKNGERIRFLGLNLIRKVIYH